MKTRRATQSVITKYQDGFRIGVILIALMGLALASCSDDENAIEPDTREQFVGNYTVEDVSASSGYNYVYNVNISKGAKGDLEITNFADMLNVPVKAKAKGNQLIIESQTFKNGSSELIVEGSGTFANDILTFKYTTKGALNYSGNCTAEKY